MSSAASLPEISDTEIRPRRRNPALRILYYAICLLVVALIAGVWWLYWMARRPLPQLDGSVTVPGISAKVRVVRDDHRGGDAGRLIFCPGIRDRAGSALADGHDAARRCR